MIKDIMLQFKKYKGLRFIIFCNVVLCVENIVYNNLSLI